MDPNDIARERQRQRELANQKVWDDYNRKRRWEEYHRDTQQHPQHGPGATRDSRFGTFGIAGWLVGWVIKLIVKLIAAIFRLVFHSGNSASSIKTDSANIDSSRIVDVREPTTRGDDRVYIGWIRFILAMMVAHFPILFVTGVLFVFMEKAINGLTVSNPLFALVSLALTPLITYWFFRNRIKWNRIW